MLIVGMDHRNQWHVSAASSVLIQVVLEAFHKFWKLPGTTIPIEIRSIIVNSSQASV